MTAVPMGQENPSIAALPAGLPSRFSAFSIGLAVATIRPIIGGFFATRRFSGLTPYEFFGTAFWIGFVLHLSAAEVWIQWTRSPASCAAGVSA